MTINYIGNTAIFLSLGLALYSAVTRKIFAAYLIFGLMTLANLAMVTALLTNDFSVGYVAQVGARETPRFYAAISLWSSLEGSILFWGWVLSGYTALCCFLNRHRYPTLIPWTVTTLFCIGIFFYLALVWPANPFHFVDPPPPNGPGPNPLLQNHWLMGLHPPMLYLGYVGMSVPFAFGVAAVLSGDEKNWVEAVRPWMLAAWTFLTIAIILGGWWSYAVLGWGGYWAWDPVENASLMPWLTATPFLHALMVEKRRGFLQTWNLFLVFATFLLTLLGTFLTRSGILESVHSFTESAIGGYFLIGLTITLCAALGLLFWRQQKVPGTLELARSKKVPGTFCSVESMILFGNLLFVAFCLVVLLGTFYPLIVETVRGVKISVGEPFFNQMAVPLSLGLIVLMGLGCALPWRKENYSLAKTLRLPTLFSLLAGGMAYLLGAQKGLVLLTILMASFSFGVMIQELITQSPKRLGPFLIHIGFLVIATAVAISGGFQKEIQKNLRPGQAIKLNDYQIQFERLLAREKPNRFEVLSMTTVYQKEKPLGRLFPQLNFYPQNREPIGSPAIRSGLKEDLYLTLMAFDQTQGEATLRVMVTPAVSWIWAGGGIILFGSWISLRRKKND